MSRLALILGSISGAFMVFMFFGVRIVLGSDPDYDTAEWIGYASMIVALSLIFVGIKSFRDKNNNGIISFGKGVQVGIMITLVASVIYAVGWLLYSSTMDPDFSDRYFNHQVEQIRNSGESEAVIQERIDQMQQFKEMYENPFVQVAFSFIEIFPVGIIVTIICALLLKRKKPDEA